MAPSKAPARAPRASTTRYVALFRGINVGGKNMLPMAKLAELFIVAGCEQVQTYIQSGNVVFTATPKIAGSIPAVIPKRVRKLFGFEPPIVVRSGKDLERIATGSPYPSPRDGDNSLHVLFLAEMPSRGQIDSLDPQRSPGDSFAVVGSEIYLHLTNGAADTRLTNAYFDSKLATVCTGRNWRTVLRLVEMTGFGSKPATG